jgi:hypothetical protein
MDRRPPPGRRPSPSARDLHPAAELIARMAHFAFEV